MKEITSSELQRIAGVSARDLENWLSPRRGVTLVTPFAPSGGRGRARTFTRENAVEITLLARLVKAGFPPSVASEWSGKILTEWAKGHTGQWLVLLDSGDLEPIMYLDEPPTRQLFDALQQGGFIYLIVNVESIVNSVDAELAEEAA